MYFQSELPTNMDKGKRRGIYFLHWLEKVFALAVGGRGEWKMRGRVVARGMF